MSAFFYSRRRSFRILLLLPGLLCVAGCGTQAQNARTVQNDLVESLRHAQADPNDVQARQWADHAIAVTPTDPDVYYGPTTPNPADPIPALSVSLVFAAVGDTPALADYLTQAVQKFPNDVRGYSSLVDAQKQLGQTASQKATAAKLVVLLSSKLKTPGTTDIPKLTLELAQAYFDAGDPINGAATYKKAVQAYPMDPEPLNGLAYAYAVQGTNLPEALGLARQSLAVAQKQGADDTTIAAIQDTLGWVQYHQGDYAEAEQNLLQAANTLPRLAETRYHLGLVYVAEGNMQAAHSELNHAVQLSQGYAAAQQALDSLPKTAVAAKP